MSQESRSPPEIVPLTVEAKRKRQASLEDLLSLLKSAQDDIGQVCELASEEENLVKAFFECLLNIMWPLTPTMPISVDTLLGDEEAGALQAHLDPTGNLIIFYQDGKVEVKNLSEKPNRDLMIRIVKDAIPRFKQLTGAYKKKVERRIGFLSSVMKEMQKMSEAFSTATT